MRRFWILAAISAGVTLTVPVTMSAGNNHEKRYYDKDAHDYHTWNGQEDRAYRVYLGEQHQEYRDFGKRKPAQQREYFKWRHEHPDNVLFKLEIK